MAAARTGGRSVGLGNQDAQFPRAIALSRWAVRRLDTARAWLERSAGHGAVIASPGRAAADDLVRDLAVRSTALLDVHRISPLVFAGELAAESLARDGKTPVAGLAREALVARAARRLLEQGELEHFAPVAAFPGFPRALARTLGEVRSSGLSPARIASAGGAGRDLARLAEAYADALARWHLVDATDIFGRARARLAAGTTHHLLGRPLLLLDLSPATTVEQRFLAKLAGSARTVLATAPIGDTPGIAGLETALSVSAHDLDAEATDGEPGGRLARLRSAIFTIGDDREVPIREGGDDSVLLLRAPGESRECVELARRVRDLAAGGLPYDRVAVVLRDPLRYLPFVEEAFARARIPVYLTRGARRPHPSGRAFLALLDCAADGLSASRFAEYLSLGELPATDETGAPPSPPVPWVEASGDQLVLATPPSERSDRDDHASEPDQDPSSIEAEDDTAVIAGTLRTPRRWERLLVDAAVVGGRDRWQRRLDGLDAELRAQMAALEDDSAAAREALDGRLRLLQNLRHFALPLIADLGALPREATWGDWLGALERLATRALRSPLGVLGVLAELRTMAEVGPVSLDDVRRTLDERLRFVRTKAPSHRYGRVFVGTPEDLRGRSFDTVLVPGLAEGMFPRRASQDPLLLDDRRRQLAESLDDPQAALETQDERFARERLLLRLAIGAAERQFVVSYPSVDIEVGRARVPSFYALDVVRASSGTLPDLADLERGADETAEAILGWPAPADATRALDEAEFDLAILEPLLRNAGDADRGAVRYLIDANAHLTQALRRRWQRWRPRLGPADGLVDPGEATRTILTEHRLGERSFSPTALQQYAICPYRFLLYAIHRLRPRDAAAPLEQLDPLTRGSLFHDVQFRLLSLLRSQGRLPIRGAEVEAIRALANAALDQAAADFEERLAPAIPQVWRSEIEGLRIDLHGWLSDVIIHDEHWRPAHFELAFGLANGEDHDPASRTEPVAIPGGALARGSIDLVEINDEEACIRVTDHKTGSASARPGVRVGAGEVLQPILYGLVAHELLDMPVRSGQLYYCTRRGGYERREVRIDEDARTAVGQVFRTIDHAVETGFFPAAPRQRACQYCDFRTVCGPDEERRLKVKIGREGQRPTAAQAKSQQRLAALFALRKMP